MTGIPFPYVFLLLPGVPPLIEWSLALEPLPLSSLTLLLDLNPLPGPEFPDNDPTSVLSSPMTRGVLSSPTPTATEVFCSRLTAIGELGA